MRSSPLPCFFTFTMPFHSVFTDEPDGHRSEEVKIPRERGESAKERLLPSMCLHTAEGY
jgi:hypothetical protein